MDFIRMCETERTKENTHCFGPSTLTEKNHSFNQICIVTMRVLCANELC